MVPGEIVEWRNAGMDITINLHIVVTRHAVGFMHALKFMPCGREEGRPYAVSVGNWRALCGNNVDQIACTHTPFIILRMQKSMRKLLGLANLPQGQH